MKDLQRLVERLKQLQDFDLGVIRQIMVELFSEGPTADAVKHFVERELRRGKMRLLRNGERVVPPGSASTTTAPTFFQLLEDGGYTFLDGGLFANDPIMVALVDALSCFNISRDNIRILSIGCGGAPYRVSERHQKGGLLAWRDVIDGTIHSQPLNAQGQAALLVGADRVARVTPASATGEPIALDDWQRSVDELVPAAASALRRQGAEVASTFRRRPALPFTAVR